MSKARLTQVGASQAADPLTPRERQVFELLALGLSQKDVAQELGVSHHTVRAHAYAIYAKLHVRNRAELALRFMNERVAELEQELAQVRAERDDALGRLRIHEFYMERGRHGNC